MKKALTGLLACVLVLGLMAVPAAAHGDHHKLRLKGRTADASLDRRGHYYVRVTDASGAQVLCGDLERKGKRWYRGQHRSCGHGHNPSSGGPVAEIGPGAHASTR